MNYALGIVVFFVIAAIASMTGIGGGTLFVPVLLLAKYSFHEATSISLFLIAVTGLSAVLRYRKENLIDWKLALVMELFTDMGSFTGGFTSVSFNPVVLKILFSVILIIVAVFTMKVKLEAKRGKEPKKGFGYWQRSFNNIRYSVPVLYMIPLVFVAGYLSGLLGIGGGAIKIPLMILWFNIPAKIAVATSSFMVSITALVGLGGHLVHETMDWKLALILSGAAFLGGQVGARFSIKMPENKVKKAIGYVFILVAVIMTTQTLITGT
ncbi:MAG: sulfite exporter TauE/SafE family protein [Bacteroidales bacterium]|nr:sulfite exporter TauE/SafE family protein [Bacteroidales bacterium]